MKKVIASKDGGYDQDLSPEEEASVLADRERAEKHQDLYGYMEERRMEYPTLQEQFDLLYWDQMNGTKKFMEAISAVKDKYPKPNG